MSLSFFLSHVSFFLCFSAPTDHFLLGNRSLSFHNLGRFDLALSDAIKATEIKPDWAKGYFRKGAALQALGRHEDAFQAFYECLTLEEEKAAKLVKFINTLTFKMLEFSA